MQRFHRERWIWWPHVATIVLFSGAAIFWFLRLAGGASAGILEWLYVLGMIILTLVSFLQLKTGVTIDERGISNHTLIGAAVTPWDEITAVRVTTAEQAYGTFLAKYFLRATADVVLAWTAKAPRGNRQWKLQVRLPESDIPALLVTLAQAPAPVALDLPR